MSDRIIVTAPKAPGCITPTGKTGRVRNVVMRR
jgi:hypothetical protein